MGYPVFDSILAYIHPDKREAIRGDVILVIKCILLSTCDEITCEELAQDFEDLEGQPIPYAALGFFGLYDFLRSIYDEVTYDANTDVVKLVDEQTLQKSAHIRKMVTNPMPTEKRHAGRLRFVHRPLRLFYTAKDCAPGTIPQKFCSLQDLEKRDLFIRHDIQLRALLLVNKNQGLDVKTFEAELNKFLWRKIDNIDKFLARLSHLFYVRTHKIYPNLRLFADDVKMFGLVPGNDKFVPLIPIRTKKYLLKLMAENPHGILWYELRDMYQAAFQFDLDYSMHGFTGVIDMVLSMGALFRCEMVHNEYHFFDRRRPFPPASQVPPNVVKKTVQLLTMFKFGIEFEYFLCLYSVVFQKKFDYELMKFASLEDALLSLQSHGVHIIPIDDDRLAFLDFEISAKTRPAIHPFLDLRRPKFVVYPDDVMAPKDLIPSCEIPHWLKRGHEIPIICADTFGPHFFFARFFLQNFSEFLEIMALFYKENHTKLQIPPNALTLGLFCAAAHNDSYHRGLIVAFSKTGPEILVLKVDSGGLVSVSRDSLYYLAKKFGRAPAQAFLCSLGKVMPAVTPQTDFSIQCYDYFDTLTSRKDWTATIISLNLSLMEMSVSLTGIQDGKTINVAQDLLDKGLAVTNARRLPMRQPPLYSVWMLYAKMYQ